MGNCFNVTDRAMRSTDSSSKNITKVKEKSDFEEVKTPATQPDSVILKANWQELLAKAINEIKETDSGVKPPRTEV